MTESESLSPMIYFDTDGEEFVTLKVLKEEETEEPSVPSSSSLPPFNDDWIVITEMKDELPVAEVSEPSNGNFQSYQEKFIRPQWQFS